MKEIVANSKVQSYFSDRLWQTVYYVGKKSERVDHNLRTVDLYLWLRSTLESWQELYFDRELHLDFQFKGADLRIRADALAIVTNKLTGERRLWFYELDNGTQSLKQFNKPELYRQYYMSKGYRFEPWSKGARGYAFPALVIVAYDEQRVMQLQRVVNEWARSVPDDELIKVQVTLWGDLTTKGNRSAVGAR